jgi:hypothetical protein
VEINRAPTSLDGALKSGRVGPSFAARSSQGNFLELELLTHNINFLANIECCGSITPLCYTWKCF